MDEIRTLLKELLEDQDDLVFRQDILGVLDSWFAQIDCSSYYTLFNRIVDRNQ